ncbi:hypothetical protein EMMF5_003009 [Cystobasidiomycetes sp. EMM_F5]
MTASIIPGALETKSKSDEIYTNYLECLDIIKKAKEANNLSLLVQLTDKAAVFQTLSDQVLTAIRNTALVYTAYCLLFCLGSLVPSIALNRAIMRKMAVLRDASQSRSSFGMRLTDGAPEYKVKLQTTPPARHSLFPVLKDRPFANTIVLETPALPARFQAILDAKTQSTAERAGQLRARLREENRYLVIYLVLLLMLSSYSLFEALGGQRKLPPDQWAPVGFYWMQWSFILAAFLVLALAVWRALKARPEDTPAYQDTDLQVLDSRPTLRGISGIQMQQQVLYTEEVRVEKEKEYIEPMSPTMLKIYTSAEQATERTEAALGPGVFDYLRTYIDNTLYGSWPAAFWTSSYCLAGLLGLILLTILSALIIKYRKDRLRWFVQDGAATRPDLRTFVPIAWSAYCILLSAE